MHEKEVKKFISYGIGIIVIYYLISALISYIILAVVGLIVWRIFCDRHRFQQDNTIIEPASMMPITKAGTKTAQPSTSIILLFIWQVRLRWVAGQGMGIMKLSYFGSNSFALCLVRIFFKHFVVGSNRFLRDFSKSFPSANNVCVFVITCNGLPDRVKAVIGEFHRRAQGFKPRAFDLLLREQAATGKTAFKHFL